ncbi:MAG TPA: hypothetical protein VMT24_15465, partial [Aggregatilineaceae bacterium]|nr:hypothetical protein [Aggregatilineaceae bacterium]
MDDERPAQDLVAQTGTKEKGSSFNAADRGILSRLRQDGLIWLVAGVTLASGLFNIMLVLALRVPASPEILDTVLPFSAHRLSRTLTLVSGFFLIYLSFHLLQRRRVAWTVTAGIALLSVMTNLGRGRGWYAALVPAFTLVVLLLTRDKFTVRSEPRSVKRGIGLLVLSMVVYVLYGTAGFWLLEPRDFGLNFRALEAFERALREFLLVG